MALVQCLHARVGLLESGAGNVSRTRDSWALRSRMRSMAAIFCSHVTARSSASQVAFTVAMCAFRLAGEITLDATGQHGRIS